MDLEQLCSGIDADLWLEAKQFGVTFEAEARAELATLDVALGGGGAYPLMYFLTRRLRPTTVVETGVAAGWTSAAVLAALEANGSGRLFSSDFPYFRLENPEQYVGAVVPEELRDRWSLELAGDRKNLPAFVELVEQIDLVHYDSDKSAGGRRFAMQVLGQKLSPSAVVVMDDIEDNLFFRDWAAERGEAPIVLEFQGKFVGIVGLG